MVMMADDKVKNEDRDELVHSSTSRVRRSHALSRYSKISSSYMSPSAAPAQGS